MWTSTAQFRLQFGRIELPLPFRYKQCGHGIADDVGEDPRFAHEAINTEDQSYGFDWDLWCHCQSGCQYNEA